MYLHNVPDQWTKGNFCSDCYSYLPIARHDLHYTDELIAGTQTAYKYVFFAGEFTEYNTSLHVSGKTNNFLWDGPLVFNTSLSVPYVTFDVGYAFCTLIRVAIRIFDVVFLAEVNFTLALWRPWKTNILIFKNITVCFITNFIVPFCFLKRFCAFPLLTILG